jgi:aminoglycoside phosphotransferase (APT) family kinase protein
MPEITQPIAAGRMAEIYPWEEGQVLKLFRGPAARESVTYEASVTAAAHAAGAPAPAVFGQIEAQGRCGILLERVHGPSILASLSRHPLRTGQNGRLLAELHADMHQRTAVGLPVQRDRLAWAINAAPHLAPTQRSAALQTLDNRPRGSSLCHMDFHPDNVILTAAGPRIIDWMTACIGDPWADVARTYLMLLIGEPLSTSPVVRLLILARDWMRRSYLQRYLSLRPDPGGEMQAWLPIIAAARLNENIPNEKEKLLAMIQKAFGAA